MTDEFIKPEWIRRVQLEPGDVLVLNFPTTVSAAAAWPVLEELQRHFPDHKVVGIGGGCELKIVHEVAA